MSVGAVNKSTGDRIPTAGMPAIDAALSGSSTNPVQNRVVKAALGEKADTDIVASDFSTAVSYTAGDYCIYDGKFYKFKTSHSGAWSAADVDEIKIAGELSSLKSGLTSLNTRLVTTTLFYNAERNVFPAEIPPTDSKQICLVGRLIMTGALILLWYDASSQGFRIGKVLDGSNPSDGQGLHVQYFA